MAKRTKIILIVLGVAALVALWLALSPGWTVSAMRNAARTGDESRIAGYVDQEAVRNGIAEQIGAQIAFSGAGKSAITPKAGVEAMNAAKDMASRLDVVKPITTQMSMDQDPEIERTGLTTFKAGPTRAGATLLYRLQGVTWRVVDLQSRGAK